MNIFVFKRMNKKMDLGLEDQGAKVVFATDEFFVQIKRIPSSSLC